MQDARTRGALIALALLIFGGSGAALYATRRPAPPPVVITQAPTLPSPEDGATAPNGRGFREAPAVLPSPIPMGEGRAGAFPAPPNAGATPRIYVHVAGAVKKPSLYALAVGSRVMQAVKAAGGPAPGADLDAVNLAERVRDGEKVYIPRQQPRVAVPSAMAAPPGNTLGHVGVMPPPSPSAPTPPELGARGRSVAGAARGGGGKADKLTSPSEGHVNINAADAAELQRLPGIGPAMAARILAYRQEAHGFHSVDDLQDVTGIGPKKFARIAPFVTLN